MPKLKVTVRILNLFGKIPRILLCYVVKEVRVTKMHLVGASEFLPEPEKLSHEIQLI